VDSRPIAIFIPSVHGGGAERAMLVFSKELVSRGYAVDLVLANLEGALTDLIPSGVRVVNLRSARMMRAIPKLIRYLRSVSPCAVYSTITHANIAATCAARFARLQAPVVVRQSNTPLSETKDSIGRFLVSRLIPMSYPSAHAIIAVSEGVKEELIALNPDLRNHVHVIPTPVLTSDVVSQAAEDPGHPWFDDLSVPIVVSAGRLKPHKGMRELIRAFHKVRAKRRAKLVILGEGSDRLRLEREISRLGLGDDVDMPGFRKNPFPFMQRAAVFVLASHYEGLPNVLVQAMSVGTPIVATDCPSGPAEILEGGRWGTLVPVGSEEALALAISEALDRPRQVAAQARAWERYGAGAATSQYLAVAGLPVVPDTNMQAGSLAE
jgi:glycosyltransferase involved in cell wall biosynthesis